MPGLNILICHKVQAIGLGLKCNIGFSEHTLYTVIQHVQQLSFTRTFTDLFVVKQIMMLWKHIQTVSSLANMQHWPLNVSENDDYNILLSCINW